MTQTIEQLKARVAELEAENARLRDGAVCGDCDGSGWLENRVDGRYPCTCMTEAEPYQLLTEQLILTQSEIKRLRDALGAFANRFPESEVAREALAKPSDTSAIDAYVAEKVKEATAGHVEDIRFKSKEIEELLRIKMSRFNNEDCWIYQGDGEDHLESLSCPVVVYPSVLIELTRQRDLAVEALEKVILWEELDTCPKSDDQPLWHDVVNQCQSALSTIKESEATPATPQ